MKRCKAPTIMFSFMLFAASVSFAADRKEPKHPGNCTIHLSPSYKPKPRPAGVRWEEETQRLADLLPFDFTESEELLALALIDKNEQAVQPLIDLCYELTEKPRLPFLITLMARKVHGTRLIRFYQAFRGNLTLGQQLLMAHDPRVLKILDGSDPSPL